MFDSRPYLNSVNETNSNNLLDIKSMNLSLQQIFYGAPGTGKSYATKDVVSNYPETIRTTFHPDSDYASFVGTYKPTTTKEDRYGLNGSNTVALSYPDGEHKGKPIKDNKIEYKFVKQAFLKAYVKAWKLFSETCIDKQELTPQFLVIEEINRGNCAQIFGDLFQLLDRKDGFSEYPIETDEDIEKALTESNPEDGLSFGEEGLLLTPEQSNYINQHFDKIGQVSQNVAEKIRLGQLLVLPPNFYIWATMNTSDQSLFPIDSAFKRRWDWKYIKITNGYKKDSNGNYIKDEDGNKIALGWKIETNGQDWWEFIRKINAIISNMTSSADKQLGFFFCKANEDGTITTESFVSKVLFYLWNDVFKDYGFEDAGLFRYTTKGVDGNESEHDLTFPDFYDEDGNVDDNVVKQFIEHVMAWRNNEKSGQD